MAAAIVAPWVPKREFRAYRHNSLNPENALYSGILAPEWQCCSSEELLTQMENILGMPLDMVEETNGKDLHHARAEGS